MCGRYYRTADKQAIAEYFHSAAASDEPLPAVTVPVLDLNDAQAIATLALAKAETHDHPAS